MKYLNLYYLLVNLIAFFMFVIDKYKSTHNKWRIPEKNLLISSLIGGALGGLIAMLVARHKIRKPKFYLLVPLFLILHIVIIGVIYAKIPISFI